MSQVTGRATITVGTLGPQRSKNGATLDFGGVKRNPVTDDQGLAGYSEESVEATIDASFTHTAGMSVQAFADIKDENINFEVDSGGVWMLQHAFIIEPPSLSGGELKCKFAGVCKEVKA